jgi:hypothetical protein
MVLSVGMIDPPGKKLMLLFLNQKDPLSNQRVFIGCGAEGIRTPDLLNAIQALSQLSYSPELVFKHSQS